MSCQDKKINALIDNELAPELRQALKSHLSYCADCQKEFYELKSTQSFLNSYQDEEVPTEITHEIMEKAYFLSRKKRSVHNFPAWALAASAAISFFLGIYFGYNAVTNSTSDTVTTTENAISAESLYSFLAGEK